MYTEEKYPKLAEFLTQKEEDVELNLYNIPKVVLNICEKILAEQGVWEIESTPLTNSVRKTVTDKATGFSLNFYNGEMYKSKSVPLFSQEGVRLLEMCGGYIVEVNEIKQKEREIAAAKAEIELLYGDYK